MKTYYTFLDEYGFADPKTFSKDPYFIVTAVLYNSKTKDIIINNLNTLKINYFGKKSYILHRSELYKDLKSNHISYSAFADDLEKTLYCKFIVFQTIVKKKDVFYLNWTTKTVYKNVYRDLFGNITKYSIAKDVNNIVLAEASSVNQDIEIYKNFFHYIANGISTLNISHTDVKQHLTSLNFVIKINNDAGEQLADLFSKSGKHKYLSDIGVSKSEDLDYLDSLLLNILKKRLFSYPLNCKNKRKILIYPTIQSFRNFP